MSQKMESVLDFTIGDSRYLRLAVDGLHVLAVVACWFNALPFSWRLMLSLSAVASWFFQRQAYGDWVGILLRYSAAEGWVVSFDGEAYFAVTMQPSSVVSGWLIVLHFKIDRQRVRSLVIFKDAMSANDYRRLIVGLKISGCGRQSP